MSAIVLLTIVETVHYGRDFTIDELNALCVKHGVAPYDPDGDTGDITAWLQDQAQIVIEREPGLQEDIERASGDVQGQDWKWEVTQ